MHFCSFSSSLDAGRFERDKSDAERETTTTTTKKTGEKRFEAIVPVIRRNKRENAALGAVQLGRRRNLRQLCQAWMHFIVGGHMRSDPTFFTIA